MDPTPALELSTQAALIAQDMREPMKAMATQMLGWLQSGAQFAQEQAPLLAQEIIWREVLSCASWGLVGLIVFVIARRVSTRIGTWAEIDKRSNGDHMVVKVISAAAQTGGLGYILFNLNWALSALLAPRVFLLEYFSRLVR